MSDFFANLAARVRNPVEGAVLPRLPSRFESPESGLAAVPDAFVEVQAQQERPLPAPRPLRKPPPADAAEPTVSRVAATPRAAKAPSKSEPPIDPSILAPTTASAITTPPAKEPAPAAVRLSRAVAAPANGAVVVTSALPAAPKAASVPSADLADGSRPQTRVETLRERVIERELIVRAPAADVPQEKRVERKSENGENYAPRIREAARRAPEVVPTVARAVTAPNASSVVPRVVRAARERSVSATAARPAETVVHVSIGRIEVRATTPSAERRRESTPSAVMSLAEYLSSRSERAR